MKSGILLILALLVIFGAATLYQSGKLGPPRVPEAQRSEFRCDGRIFCSQMTSCNEAQFFLKNCPGTQMDGDGDKVPCEKEWCGHSISHQNHF